MRKLYYTYETPTGFKTVETRAEAVASGRPFKAVLVEVPTPPSKMSGPKAAAAIKKCYPSPYAE